MKQLLSIIMLVTLSLSKGFDAQAQIFIKLPDGLVNESRLKAYVDSAIAANKTSIATPVDPVPPMVTPPVVTPPISTLPPCAAGPEIRNILEVTSTNLKVQFHGENVQGIDWKVQNTDGKLVSSGAIRPQSNILTIPYTAQNAGTFTLVLSGNTCSGTSQKTFEIPKSESVISQPKPVEGQGNYELILNTTGYGFDPNDPTGINKDWRERIEAFKYPWGYGITTVRILVRWYEWEPAPGRYKEDALRNAIRYCQDRGLKFAVFFWPWREEKDGFIIRNEVVRGNHGSRHILEERLVMGSLVSDYTNNLLRKSATRLGEVMAEFPNSYYATIGAANAEEYINPWIQQPYEKNAAGQYEHKSQPEIGGFEAVFQSKYKDWQSSRNRVYAWPEVIEWGDGVALQMNSENGKDFARFISLSLKNYFENFAAGIKEGSENKVLTAYMYPDVGSSQNAYHLHANFADQAAAADIMYGTDGNTVWDISRKLVCNAVNKGFGKISLIEVDAEDVGQGTGRPRYCSGEIQYNVLDKLFRDALAAGTNGISFAMAFCPDEIRAMEPILKPYFETHFGHPYRSPNFPIKTIDITPAYWTGQEIYVPHFEEGKWLYGSSENFWGGAKP